jgi:hypothetical protein
MQQLRVLQLNNLSRDCTQMLLAAMPCLARLAQLSLAGSCEHRPQPEQWQHYAALLPPSNALACVSAEGLFLPEGCLQHIFAAGRQYPALTALRLTGREPADSNHGAGSSADGVALLAASCPRLRELRLHDIMQPGDSLLTLQQLPSLTRLEVHDKHSSRRSSSTDVLNASELAQLTGLRHLYRVGRRLKAAELVKLTTLFQLTDLFVNEVDGRQRLSKFRFFSQVSRAVEKACSRLVLLKAAG